MTNLAYFAEIDVNNKVLRVTVACPIDVANNGGDMSEQAAENFKKTNPLSTNGVKWVQSCKNNSFRKQHAGIGDYFDEIKNKFIRNKPYPSWILNINDDWEPPVNYPSVFFVDNNNLFVNWDEDNLRWLGTTIKQEGSLVDSVTYQWNPNTSNWSLL